MWVESKYRLPEKSEKTGILRKYASEEIKAKSKKEISEHWVLTALLLVLERQDKASASRARAPSL